MKKRLKLQTVFVFHGSEPQFYEKNNKKKQQQQSNKNNNKTTAHVLAQSSVTLGFKSSLSTFGFLLSTFLACVSEDKKGGK